jgi:hypothetical protein
MKKILLSLLLISIISACRSSNGPQSGAPATMPTTGMEFTYSVQDSIGTITEVTAISNLSNDQFLARRLSDTLGGFFTSDSEHYSIHASGDLFEFTMCGCDTVPFPVCSHQTLTANAPGAGIPMKLNGYIYTVKSVTLQTRYDDEENVPAAGTTFPCSKVTVVVTMIQSSQMGLPDDTEQTFHDYWYSRQLGFFVKDQELTVSGNTTRTNFTRTLTSYK